MNKTSEAKSPTHITQDRYEIQCRSKCSQEEDVLNNVVIIKREQPHKHQYGETQKSEKDNPEIIVFIKALDLMQRKKINDFFIQVNGSGDRNKNETAKNQDQQ